MIEFPADLVLFNVLKNRDYISHCDLKAIRDRVQEKFQNVYLYICRDDIYETLRRYPDYFVKVDNLHTCRLSLYSKEKFEEMRECFDYLIPDEGREEILKILQEA